MFNTPPLRCLLRFNRPSRVGPAALLLLSAFAHQAGAQGGFGSQGSGAPSPTAPAASSLLKVASDRSDPLDFLLDRKKALGIPKPVEDSLKNFRKEMRHMQDVVYKDLDKAAAKKEGGQPPSAAVIQQLTNESEKRIKDIQDAYRDRARALLNDQQRQQVDSLEAVWKRSEPQRPATPPRRPPPPPPR